MSDSGLVLMGRSSGAFGLKGEVKVFSYAQDLATFADAEKIMVGPNPESARPFTLKGFREHGGRLLLKLAGVDGKEAADGLKGLWVYLPREQMPPANPDEFYLADLIGARVQTVAGRHLGTVARFIPAGPKDLVVIQNGQNPELWVPLESDFLSQVDESQGLLVLDLPEGLLESQGWTE